MGYPDTEQADKRSQLLPKVVTSLTKRLGKLDELKTEMGSAETNSTFFFEEPCLHTLFVTCCVQNTPVNSTFAANHMPAFGQWRYLRMKEKVLDMYKRMDKLCDSMNSLHHETILDGPSTKCET